MRKMIMVCLLIVPSYAMAQDVAANKAAVKAAPKVEDPKPKPVILDEVKRLRMTVANQALELAKRNLKDAEDAVAAFWREIGINPAELSTKWEASNGQNGDIILLPRKEIVEKPKTQ